MAELSELDMNMPEDVRIYDNKQGSEYVSYNTYSLYKLILIQLYSETVKDLRWSALEK